MEQSRAIRSIIVGVVIADALLNLSWNYQPLRDYFGLDTLEKREAATTSIALPTIQDAKNMSSVDYYGCCGAGHRLQRTALAHYVAQKGGFAFRVNWNFCDGIEVYNHLFGPQPLTELVNVTDQHHTIRFVNEVANFVLQWRPGLPEKCKTTHLEFARANVEYYSSLRNRFRFNDRVEAFRERHFEKDAIVIGMHIRAGNGEEGDFTRKKRGIENVDEWLRNVVDRILEQKQAWFADKKVVLFLATDTHSMVEKMQHVLQGTSIVLVHNDQTRPDEGSGVLFGEGGHVVTQGEKCLAGWESAFMDIMLLSYAHVLVAPRYSSFTVTLPMNLVLFSENRTVERPYCEMDMNATSMICYQDFPDWCANGTTRVRGDWMYIPPDPVNFTDSTKWEPQLRNQLGVTPKQAIPYNWSEWLEEEK